MRTRHRPSASSSTAKRPPGCPSLIQMTGRRSLTRQRARQGPGSSVLRLLVPADVPNGKYTGVVRVLTTVDEKNTGGGSGVGVNVGAEISVTLNLTGTQNVAGSLVDVTAGDVETGSPFRIKTTVQNSGNVQVNPQIDLQVLDLKGAIVGTASFSEDLVYPDEIRDPDP